MKLVDVLKSAIQSADWQKVCLVYYHLSEGEVIDPPKVIVHAEPIVLRSIKPADIEIPDETLEQRYTNDPIIVTIPQSPDTFTTSIKSLDKPLIQKSRTNTFVDDLTEAVEDLQGPNRKVTQKKPRSPDRKSATMRARCCECHKIVETLPIYAHGYSADEQENTFKCEECLQSLVPKI